MKIENNEFQKTFIKNQNNCSYNIFLEKFSYQLAKR